MCGVPYTSMDTAPSFLWRSYDSTAGGTLYSLSISGALILYPSTPPLLFMRAM